MIQRVNIHQLTMMDASLNPKSLKLNGFFSISPLSAVSSTIPIIICSGSCLPEIIYSVKGQKFLQNTYLLQSTYRIHLSYRLQSLYILVSTVLLTIRSISDRKSTNFSLVILQTSATLHLSAICPFNNKIYL